MDGLVNSADAGIVGDTNGDGVVNATDTGLVADPNGKSHLPPGERSMPMMFSMYIITREHRRAHSCAF